MTKCLGRSVFSSSAARRADRGTIVRDAFLVRLEDDCVSADRMDYAPVETMASLANARGEERRTTFYGWATLIAGAARSGDAEYRRTVEASPLPENPYHANIVMAVLGADVERRDIQKQHALALAKCAKWLPRPHSTSQAMLTMRLILAGSCDGLGVQFSPPPPSL